MKAIVALMIMTCAAAAAEPPAYKPVEPPAVTKAIPPCGCGCMVTGKCQCKNCCERTADPAWTAPLKAEATSYAAVYARVLAGEKVIVANGIAATQGQVASVIPGETPGIYECWSESQKVCHGSWCEIRTTCHMTKQSVPQPMPATKGDGPSINLDGMFSAPSGQAPSCHMEWRNGRWVQVCPNAKR